ncbi:MAG: amidohydrolase, partial [Bacteroidetes bacterium]|nr:amidohydrolase [Bacteroidota bacterium]
PIYPGFIDAHCHFYGYGLNLQNLDLTGTKSFDEVIEKVISHRKKYPGAQWIIGRGWDQNDWKIKEFPAKDTLDKLFPDTPVFLRRIDGHAALANQAALKRTNVTSKTEINGGLIQKSSNGTLTGILIDNAMELVSGFIQEPTYEEKINALLNAQKECFEAGLTTVDDAGLDRSTIDLIDSLQKAGKLTMRIYAMISYSEENKNYYFDRGIYKTDKLNVRSFKLYADGALGSRGACLIEPYNDKAGHYGFLLQPQKELKQIAKQLYENNFQMNTHCIGDSANRMMLNIYGELLKGKNDKRWRIEHAQVVSKEDINKFGKFNIIPSIQPTHCTSDMYWAESRLGNERISTAYAYRDLFFQNNLVASGSDFPVESINPLFGFYAAVTRKDQNKTPENGFQPENSLSREQALKSMTIWAAYANFEEQEKGSIQPGKFADFVILEDDIMQCEAGKIYEIKVGNTYIGGKKVY